MSCLAANLNVCSFPRHNMFLRLPGLAIKTSFLKRKQQPRFSPISPNSQPLQKRTPLTSPNIRNRKQTKLPNPKEPYRPIK